tara:strand:+ start:1139 stop:1348 length:210 start_codon:yes stop_codon:yes gene_type:complete
MVMNHGCWIGKEAGIDAGIDAGIEGGIEGGALTKPSGKKHGFGVCAESGLNGERKSVCLVERTEGHDGR